MTVVLALFVIFICGVVVKVKSEENIIVYGINPVGCELHDGYFIVANKTKTSVVILNISKNGSIVGVSNLSFDILRMGNILDFSYVDGHYYFLIKSNTYSILVVNETYNIERQLIVNYSNPNVTFDSVKFYENRYWLSYHRNDYPLAGVIRLNEWLNDTELNITLKYSENITDRPTCKFIVNDSDIWIVDSEFSIYHGIMTGEVEIVKNVREEVYDVAKNIGATNYELIDLTNNATNLWICVLYTVGSESAIGFVSHPIPKLAVTQTYTTVQKITTLERLNSPLVGFSCGVLLLLLMVVTNKLLTVVQPTMISKESALMSEGKAVMKKEAPAVEEIGEEGAEMHVKGEELPSAKIPGVGEEMEKIKPPVYKKIEEKGIFARLRYLLGLRKIRHIPEKDKPEKPNFNKAMGYAALLGLIIGIVAYFVAIIEDIYVSIGTNVGLMLSVIGITGSTILIWLKNKGEINYGKLMLFMLLISYIIGGLGLYINTNILVKATIYIALLDIILALLLAAHRYARYRIIRSAFGG